MARTPKESPSQKRKVHKVMKEYKEGDLHSGKRGPGKGPAVKSRKQAIAIALSEAGASRPPLKGKSRGNTKTGKAKTSTGRAATRHTTRTSTHHAYTM